jgi:hypothetical protein
MGTRLIVAVKESRLEKVKEAVTAVAGNARVYVALIVEGGEDNHVKALIAAMSAGASTVTKA